MMKSYIKPNSMRIIFICVLLVFFTTSSAQQIENQEELKYEVSVTLKLIQVYITDKSGNPVRNLRKEDFILYDNGKQMAITDFETHFLNIPKAPSEQPALKDIKQDKAATKTAQPEAAPSQMNRKFFLIVDAFRNQRRGIVKSKTAAIHFIESQLQPTDEVSILTLSETRGLVLHEYLTTDHRKAVETVQDMNVLGAMGGIGPSSFTVSTGREGIGAETISDAAALTSLMQTRTANYSTILKDLSKAFRHIPGYKNVIFYSAGIANSVLYKRTTERLGMTDDGGLLLRTLYEDAAKELGSSSSPVYTINTGPQWLNMDASGDQALGRLARFSGGKYYDNVDNYEEIASDIQSITGNYYVLGYSIDEKWDGKFHEIKVETTNKQHKVYAQAGYFNPKPFSQFTEFEKWLHLIDLALGNNPYFDMPFKFSLQVIPYTLADPSGIILLTKIPVAEIGEVIRGNTEIFSLVFDERNNLIDQGYGEYNFAGIIKKDVYHYAMSSLKPGLYHGRFVIRNLKNGKSAVASNTVEIPAPLDRGVVLFPPMILVPAKESVYLKSNLKSQGNNKKNITLKHVCPILSSEKAPLVEFLDFGVTELQAVVRYTTTGIEDPEIGLELYLFGSEVDKAEELHATILSSTMDEYSSIVSIAFQLPELESGAYSIKFVLKERISQASDEFTQSLIIR